MCLSRRWFLVHNVRPVVQMISTDCALPSDCAFPIVIMREPIVLQM